MKNSNVFAAALIAVGIMVLGYFIKSGIEKVIDQRRQVEVKGASEREVSANRVTWTVTVYSTGNNIEQLYADVRANQQQVVDFLKNKGVAADDIHICVPNVSDLEDNYWGENKRDYRFRSSAVVNVVSNNVDKVRAAANSEGELIATGLYFDSSIDYEFTSFQDMKPEMMAEAIANAEKTAQQFAENSHSEIDKIITADQGQFSIDDRDENTPEMKKIRVVTTITYSLKD